MRRGRGLCVVSIVAVTAVMLAGPGAQPAAAQFPTAADFGYAQLAPPNRLPLLTILVDWRDQGFDHPNPADYYEKLLYNGSRFPNVAGERGMLHDYTVATRRGRFAFRNVGILKVRYPDDRRTAMDESSYACAYMGENGCQAQSPFQIRTTAIQAAGQQIDFADLEKRVGNGDGTLSTNEAKILLIFAERTAETGGFPRGGQWQDRRFLGPGGVIISTGTAGVGERASSTTLAHELLHSFGLDHVYGSNCVDDPYTVMSCTIEGQDDIRDSVHPDPYTKMRLGWAPAAVRPLREGCFTIKTVNDERGVIDLLYDSALGKTEYYLLEFRLPRPNNYDGDPWGTGAFPFPERGLGVWYALTDSASNLRLINTWWQPPVDSNRDGASDNADLGLYLLPAATPQGPARSGGLLDWGESTRLRRVRPNVGPAAPMSTFVDHPRGYRVKTIQYSEVFGTLKYEVSSPRWLHPCRPGRRQPDTRPRGRIPALEDGPCKEVSEIVRCAVPNPDLVVQRRIKPELVPGEPFDVGWSVRLKRSIDGPVRITEELPRGFERIEPARASQVRDLRETKLTFRGLSKRGPKRLEYTVQPPTLGGLYEWKTHVQYRDARGRTRERTLRSGVWVTPFSIPPEPVLYAGGIGGPDPPASQPTEPPDLVIDGLAAFSVTVRNVGQGAAGSFVVTVTGGHSFTIDGLAAGASATRTWDTCYAGKITANADANGSIVESNEDNNTASISNTC